jgi:hypothetical protein
MATPKSPLKSPSAPAPAIRKVVYGWLPDIPDNRDHMYGAVRKVPAKLPAKVDLRPGCSKVGKTRRTWEAVPPTPWPVRWNS